MNKLEEKKSPEIKQVKPSRLTVRRMVIDDLKHIMKMMSQFAQETRQILGEKDLEEIGLAAVNLFSQQDEKKGNDILVAEMGSVVGCIWYQTAERLYGFPKAVMLMQHFYVKPKYRGQGVSDALYDEVIRIAGLLKVDAIEHTTEENAIHIQKFLERRQFNKEMCVFRRLM